MAKRPAPKRAPAQAAQPQPYGERLYGPGRTPSLYNGQPSPLAPVTDHAPVVNTASGQNSPNAAPHANAANMLGSTQASLIPGVANPMAIYAATTPRHPNAEGSEQ